MPTLETTLMIATRAHYGRVDKGGHPYILHPIRLMLKQDSLEAQQVALLHDVPEDTDLTIQDLCDAGFSEPVLDALDAITLRPSENYLNSYIERVDRNPLARAIKIDDLLDNMDMSRLQVVTGKDLDRIEQRYKPALKRLLNGPEPLVQIQIKGVN